MPTFEPTPSEIADAREVLAAEMSALREPAERHIFRTQTDFIGRLCQAYAEVDDVFDEAPEGELSPEQAERAYAAYQEIASLAVAQLTFIRMQHPGVGAET